MEYLLIMTLSGSTMTTGCWLLRFLLKDRVSARLYYILAKTAVLYYLIPLPFLKKCYCGAIRAVVPESQMAIAQISLAWTKYAVHADGRMYVNAYAEIQMITVGVWLSVACFLMTRQLTGYLRTIHRIARYTNSRMTNRQKELIAELKKEYGIRRRVLLYQGEAKESSMTFGVCRPVIICGVDTGSREGKLLIRHEMVHIKRMDVLWKMFLQFAKFLHWCNPFMWLLYREFDRVCEMSCDETAMRGRTEEEVKAYLLLLIREAQKEVRPRRTLVRWRAGFGNNKRKIRERMDNLMRKKRWNRFAVGVLAATMIFANSMTAFAYKDTVNEIVPEGTSQEEIESTLNRDMFLFTPDGTDGEETQTFVERDEITIQYDMQFIDEEGNIYPIPDVESHLGCNHTYVSGTVTAHEKKSDGGCVVTEYRAQRCSKCGTILRGDLISTTTYVVCPH